MISLYIHIPFCKKKCRYCDFISYECALQNADAYIDALLNEAQLYRSQQVTTVFIGGGTPSLLSVEQIDYLITGLKSILDFSCCYEFTIEANPESLDECKLKKYKDLGINRLSIGLQSALDDELKMLGRIHNFERFIQVYKIARRYFDNINIDLISALPGQSLNDFAITLNKVVCLKPEHISVYSLIPEEGTPLYNDLFCGKLPRINDDVDREIYTYTGEYLKMNGYFRYEISNYSKPNYECKHNLTYWEGRDYVGIGCAAHSFYNGVRSEHDTSIEKYIESPRPLNHQVQTDKDKYEEFIMLRLRLSNGFSLNEFNNIFGYDFYKRNQDIIKQLIANGIAQIYDGRFMLTSKGFDVCDSVILKLI